MTSTGTMGCTWEDQNQIAQLIGIDDTAKASQLSELLCNKWNATASMISSTNNSMDGAFVLTSASLVFFMQMGFAMLCAGAVRTKNCMNICLMNVLDPCFSCPAFFLVGYGFIHGHSDHSNGFIGSNDFALIGFKDWHVFIFQWAFAAAAATITTGSVAERCTFQAYIGYSIFLSAFVYPIVAHWVWSQDGWLTGFKSDPLMGSGMIDFAGSGCVHMVGGLAGMMGAVVLGSRVGRFDSQGRPEPGFDGHSMTLVVIGTLTLWFGWFGFNPGSQGAIHGPTNLEVVGRTLVCTTLSASAGGIGGLLWKKVYTGSWELMAVCNGLLCGLVSITGGCSVVEPAAALVCGFVAALVFETMCKSFLKMQIDDPLCAAPMHGFCGIWGLLFAGLAAKEQYINQVFDRDAAFDTRSGMLYGGGAELMCCQILGIVSIGAWTCSVTGVFFYLFHLSGNLRVSRSEETYGLDQWHHGGDAYNDPDVLVRRHRRMSAENALPSTRTGSFSTLPWEGSVSPAHYRPSLASTTDGIAIKKSVSGSGSTEFVKLLKQASYGSLSNAGGASPERGENVTPAIVHAQRRRFL